MAEVMQIHISPVFSAISSHTHIQTHTQTHTYIDTEEMHMQTHDQALEDMESETT